MANKPAPKKWIDIQLVIATISMASTLVFWNMFAGPDREAAAKRAQEQAVAIPPQPTVTAQPIVAAQSIVTAQPTPLGDGKILFGGSAPQTKIIVQTSNRNGGGGGSGGGGGGVTSTGSS
jgi:hypothetical protein